MSNRKIVNYKKMFFYQTAPVDFFSGMVRAEDYIKHLQMEHSGSDADKQVSDFIKHVMYCTRAVSLALNSYWEGDVRGNDLYVFQIPYPSCGNEIPLGVMWKQDNNGDSYICSPVKLDWIDSEDMLVF